MCSPRGLPHRKARPAPRPCTRRTNPASSRPRARSLLHDGRAPRLRGAVRRPDRWRSCTWLPFGYLLLQARPRPAALSIASRLRRSAAGKARGDLLDVPAISVRIAERHERAVALVIRRGARGPVRVAGVMEDAAGVVEHLADVDTVTGELGTRRFDVGDDELQAFRRARCSSGDVLAEDD